VQIAGVPVAVDPVDVEIEHAGRMGAVDKAEHARSAAIGGDLFNRESKSRWACDMIDDDQPRAVVDRVSESRARVLRAAHRQWNVDYNHLASKALRLCMDSLPNGVVSVV